MFRLFKNKREEISVNPPLLVFEELVKRDLDDYKIGFGLLAVERRDGGLAPVLVGDNGEGFRRNYFTGIVHVRPNKKEERKVADLKNFLYLFGHIRNIFIEIPTKPFGVKICCFARAEINHRNKTVDFLFF